MMRLFSTLFILYARRVQNGDRMKNSRDTIAAIASSSSNGGISVIRLSGESSLEVIDKVYCSKTGNKKLSEQKSHTIHYGFICNDEMIIDEVIILLMLSPNSYTREDVVEIDCHGGYLVAKMILELLVKAGARIAEPGEFTKRAFLNGRIDLSQAEAVSDIINAKNKYALQSSICTLRGNIKESMNELKENLLMDVAFIEAALDDPEHISLDGYSEELDSKVTKYLKKLYRIRKNCENGRILKEGINTVILGKPNVGKSSLLNILLRQDRAIVTSVPGTTRDTLEEEVQIGDIILRITDTAGIRETEDEVEQIGIEKAKQSLERADFVITVFDCSQPFDEDDKKILELAKNLSGVVLLNKSDLNQIISEDDLRQFTDKKVLDFSAKASTGLEELEDYLKELFYLGKLSFNDEIYISNMRQKEALLEGIESLEKVKESIAAGMSEDFLTIDLVDALEAFGRIIGETIEDDIIDTIFREFCMGK